MKIVKLKKHKYNCFFFSLRKLIFFKTLSFFLLGYSMLTNLRRTFSKWLPLRLKIIRPLIDRAKHTLCMDKGSLQRHNVWVLSRASYMPSNTYHNLSMSPIPYDCKQLLSKSVCVSIKHKSWLPNRNQDKMDASNIAFVMNGFNCITIFMTCICKREKMYKEFSELFIEKSYYINKKPKPNPYLLACTKQ